jgi:hypothetical protein
MGFTAVAKDGSRHREPVRPECGILVRNLCSAGYEWTSEPTARVNARLTSACSKRQ